MIGQPPPQRIQNSFWIFVKIFLAEIYGGLCICLSSIYNSGKQKILCLPESDARSGSKNIPWNSMKLFAVTERGSFGKKHFLTWITQSYVLETWNWTILPASAQFAYKVLLCMRFSVKVKSALHWDERINLNGGKKRQRETK